MRISCLHADAACIAEFESAAPADIALVHYLAGPAASPTRVASAVEAQLLLSRVARGSDAVLVTCPRIGLLAPPPALTFLDLLIEAISRLPGPVEAIGIRKAVPPALEAALARSGTALSVVPEPARDGGEALGARLDRGGAQHFVLLDTRLGLPGRPHVHSAAALALSALARPERRH